MVRTYGTRVHLALAALVLAAALPTLAAAENEADLPPLTNTSVNIPWRELRELLLRARPPGAEPPPVNYVFSPADYSGAVAEKQVTVTAACEVTTLSDGWAVVGLGSAVAGVRKVTADGEPCRLLTKDGGLYALFSGKGRKKLEMVVVRPVKRGADGGSFDVPLLPSPIVNFAVEIPQAMVEVTAPSASAAKTEEKGTATVFSGSFRGGETATISWKSKPPADKLPPRIYAETVTNVAIGSGFLRCRATVRYEILRGGVDTLRIALPEDVELLRTECESALSTESLKEGKANVLVIRLKEVLKGEQVVSVVYERRLKEGEAAPEVPLVAHPGAVQDQGSVGIEARGALEVTATAQGAERVDVRELPGSLWSGASVPILIGFKYVTPGARIALAVTKHKDARVLVAMADICEAATVVTAEGKAVSKLMYIVRNNSKQFMTLRLPEGAEVWSAFVDDHPVVPVLSDKGEVLVPLRKSADVTDEDDEDGDSYRAKRDKRRSGDLDRAARDRVKRLRVRDSEGPARDLKPYDVEIVLAGPQVELAGKPELKLSLPTSDIPTGHMAWAVFLPKELRVVDVAGSLKEVSAFSLRFRHFGEAEWLRTGGGVELRKMAAAELQMKAQDQLAKLADVERAKAEGVLPVRIEIPIVGEIVRFEKFLVTTEAPEVRLTVRKRAE